MEYCSAIKKERSPALCNNMGKTWGHYAKWNKSEWKRQIFYDLYYIWNQKETKNTSNKQKKIRFVVTRGRNLEVEQLDGSDQKVLEIHKYWGCNVQQLTLLLVCLKVAARVNPKNSIRRTFFFLFCSCVRRWILTKSIVVSFCSTFVLSHYELHLNTYKAERQLRASQVEQW